MDNRQKQTPVDISGQDQHLLPPLGIKLLTGSSQAEEKLTSTAKWTVYLVRLRKVTSPLSKLEGSHFFF